MNVGRRAFPWKPLLAVLALAALAFAWRSLPLGAWIASFEAWVADLGPLAGVVYGLAYVAAALLFVPGSLLTLGAGLVFGLGWGIVLVSISSTTAAALAFLIARYLARPRVEALARKNEKFRAIDAAIGQKGWKIVGLLRLSPVVPFSISNYLYGLTAVRFWPYVLASWIGMLPATVLYVYLGAAGRTLGTGRARSPWQIALLVVGLAATVAVTVILTRVARRELARARLAGGLS
jgi:uncharacterized membrane protein YdjX (TVP38/TMEM64 family)